ncbi:MAG TPA: M48 family metallopeptidase [Thermoanaerobaculia bacterium]|nr:M48 family metallopeptidase [Thermoanaerobaculia bacterium]
MRNRWLAGWVLVLVGIAAGKAAAVTRKEQSAAFDARIARQLAALDPAAAALFAQANEAREKKDHQRARDLYARVHERVPTFSHAVRREGFEELSLGHREPAIALYRQALALETSAANLSSLASGLATPVGGQPVPEAERKEALDLARRATQLEPDDFFAQATLAQAALVNDDLALLQATSDRLVTLAPEEPVGYFFRSIAEASRGELDRAEASLAQAHARGLSAKEYQSLRDAIQKSRPWYSRFLGPALVFLAAWAVGFLLLFSSGWALSRATLRAAQRVPGQASGEATRGDLRLRRIYRGVLWLSCLYYWLSMPVVALLVLAAGGGALYGILAMGYIPIKLVVVIVILLFVTLRAMAKGLFARSRDEDPGLRLEPDEEPRLRDLLHEVAGKIGTRPVDRIYLTPGTDLAVMERGGLLRQFRGATERCLILGVGVLDGLPVGPFKAILAHEYGHFSNRDTAGGGFSLQVRRSVWTMAFHLAQHGAAAWYNPAWLFVNGFHRVFLRISQGASRLQEVLADRWATFAYGAAAFERGLRHVVERAIRFSAHAEAALGEVIETKRPLANLYSYRPAAEPDARKLDEAVNQAIHRDPSPYDSHPSPANRIQWTQALATPNLTTSPEDEAESWSLFHDRVALERRLTATVKENLRDQQGIVIPDEPEAAAVAV